MWRDKFQTAQSTPAGTPPPISRFNSPAPLRGPYASNASQALRPPINPRSTSLASLASISNTSLPDQARLPNGSSLRNEVRQVDPASVPEPAKVLERLLGKPSRKRRADGTRVIDAPKPGELVQSIDFAGLSLQEFVVEEPAPRLAANGPPSSAQSAEEYGKEKDKFEDLHKSIAACDQVLDSVETYLQGFQADLGTVSAEIETLQTRSTTMNSRLENRRVVEKLLGPAVEDVSLQPAVVRKIADGPIDDGWGAALAELEKKAMAVAARSKEHNKVKAVEDVKPLLTDLTNRAVERIRDHLVSQIKALRSPNVNAQIIQQQGFLRFRELFVFLAREQKQLAEEIGQAYINTMRWYYLNHFQRYDTALKQLKLHTIDKSDVLGSFDDPNRRAKGGPPTYDAFALGRRMDVLKGNSHSALSSYLVEESKSSHYLETPFYSLNLAVLDNASYEYGFLTSFFSTLHSHHAIVRMFDSIFAPTFAIARTTTKSLVEPSVDALGVLLCVRINQHFAFELQRRKVPAVEGYVNGTNMLLWPRFQQVMDLHCDSLRKATSNLPSRPSAGGLLSSGSAAAAAAQSAAPHPLTQRFASFLQGILTLSSEAGDDEPVSNSLTRLRTEFEAFLTRLSKTIGDQRKRERFLANNYSLVGTILESAEGRLAGDFRTHFDQLKDAHESGNG